MFVSRKRYELAVGEATAANDRLDMILGENERILGLLKLALSRRPKPKPEIVPSKEPIAETPPSIVMAAIKSTFPGDAQIYSANYTYALSQRHRWEDAAEAIAQEIVKGKG